MKMKSKYWIAAAVYLLLAAGWGCEQEKCEAGVKDGNVDIPDEIRSYFDFNKDSEWFYSENSTNEEYFVKAFSNDDAIGTGVERSIRCVLGRSILTWFISSIDSIPESDDSVDMNYYIVKYPENDTLDINLNFFLEIYRMNYVVSSNELIGKEGCSAAHRASYPLGQDVYQDVFKIWKENKTDTLFFAPNTGLIKLVHNQKTYELKRYSLL